MSQTFFPKIPCYHYDRDDWLKVDVSNLLSPWVNRVAEVYKIGKTPAKHIVTYAIWLIAAPNSQEIMDTIFKAFEEKEVLQSQYGTRFPLFSVNTNVLNNSNGLCLTKPRQVNFMDLVDYWAAPINRNFGIGIVQCRDVVKITLALFIFDKADLLVQTISALAANPTNEIFFGTEKFPFPEMNITIQE